MRRERVRWFWNRRPAVKARTAIEVKPAKRRKRDRGRGRGSEGDAVVVDELVVVYIEVTWWIGVYRSWN
jgi:hypothetical protein